MNNWIFPTQSVIMGFISILLPRIIFSSLPWNHDILRYKYDALSICFFKCVVTTSKASNYVAALYRPTKIHFHGSAIEVECHGKRRSILHATESNDAVRGLNCISWRIFVKEMRCVLFAVGTGLLNSIHMKFIMLATRLIQEIVTINCVS